MKRLFPAVRVPLLGGRLVYLPAKEDAELTAGQLFDTRLFALHRDGRGKVVDDNRGDYGRPIPGLGYDLGSGLVTNVGVMAMGNDYAWSAQLNLSTIGLANNHAWGTGATAAAATDVTCQTLAAPTTTSAVAGVQSNVSTANSQQYRTVATITAGGSLAITEWGLHSLITLTSSTGTPFTATTATTWQDTGSAQTASSATVRGLQQTVVMPGTTTVYGLNLSNTTHIGTLAIGSLASGWFTVAAGTGGSTPGATEAFTIRPVLWDHKVFTAINVVNLDSIQFTYTLTINSGG